MQLDGYTFAHLELTVAEFVEGLGELPKSMRLAWVTCVDSQFDVVNVAKHHRVLGSRPDAWQPLDGGVLLKTQVLQEINRQERIFFGFDELWFLPKRPHRVPKLRRHIVAPIVADRRSLSAIAAAMHDLDCSLVIGDGEGLNFMTKVPGAARTLFEAASFPVATTASSSSVRD